ncbi:hypothetical protein JTB14_027448 [Gonioctena quinquepunctata]|nr:hypothetical protein JTB14_027448 [Gonioctena quinquepunctata]
MSKPGTLGIEQSAESIKEQAEKHADAKTEKTYKTPVKANKCHRPEKKQRPDTSTTFKTEGNINIELIQKSWTE